MSQVYSQAQAAGQDDDTFIRRFRESVKDRPRFFNENFNGDNATTVFICQRAPINDDEFFDVSVGGSSKVYTTSWPPSAGQVYVDFDTGNMIFQAAPPTGVKNVVVTKRIARWRDGTVLNAMLDGLRQCWPQLWTTYVDTTLTVQQDTYDYALPPQFNDPAVLIASVSVQEIPSSIEPFRQINGWDRVGTNVIHLLDPNRYTPGAVLRIVYQGPFTSLGDLQPSAYELPVLYAAGSLMGYGEQQRTVDNTMTVQGPEQALPPGQMQAAGSWYMQQFQTLRDNLSRPMPHAGWRSTYRR